MDVFKINDDDDDDYEVLSQGSIRNRQFIIICTRGRREYGIYLIGGSS